MGCPSRSILGGIEYMSEALEALERAEKMEHSSHGSHGGGHGRGKMIGLTMGLIGVLIALCAALVGGERNEMSRAMIEQTQATADATSASTKFRVIMVDIEHMLAQPPETLTSHVRDRFVRLYDDYLKERKITSAWAASYQPLIDAHFDAAEGYEHAQLAAEIGIVFASLAVLLANRAAWLLSIALGLGSVGMVGKTHFEAKAHLASVEENIEQHLGAYKELRSMHVGDHADADAADALDPGGAIRARIAQEEKSAMAAHPPAAEHEEHH